MSNHPGIINSGENTMSEMNIIEANVRLIVEAYTKKISVRDEDKTVIEAGTVLAIDFLQSIHSMAASLRNK